MICAQMCWNISHCIPIPIRLLRYLVKLVTLYLILLFDVILISLIFSGKATKQLMCGGNFLIVCVQIISDPIVKTD